jgi:WD40 repeat protein
VTGEVQVWDAATGQVLLTLKGHLCSITSVAWSPAGKRIVSGSRDYTLKVWNAETGQELLTHYGHTHDVQSVAWSPDGKRILSGSGDGMLKVWDVSKE